MALPLSIIVDDRKFNVQVPDKLQKKSVGALVRKITKRAGSIKATVRNRSVDEAAIVAEALAAGDEVLVTFAPAAATADAPVATPTTPATRRQVLRSVAAFAFGDGPGAADGLRAGVFRGDAVAKYALGAALAQAGDDAEAAAKAFASSAALAEAAGEAAVGRLARCGECRARLRCGDVAAALAAARAAVDAPGGDKDGDARLCAALALVAKASAEGAEGSAAEEAVREARHAEILSAGPAPGAPCVDARRAARAAAAEAAARRAAGDLGEAVAAAERGVAYDGRAPEPRVALAVAKDAMGDTDGALAGWFAAKARVGEHAFRAEISACATGGLRRSFHPTDEDCFVCTFPKSGTTWLQMVCLLVVDERLRSKRSIDAVTEAPWLEAAVATGHCTLRELQDGAYPRNPPRPRRVFKTHATVARFPAAAARRPGGAAAPDPGLKILVCTRNPKDTCVSLYHHARAMPSETHDYHLTSGWNQFLADFLDGNTAEAEAGDWFDWTLRWHEASLKHPENVLLLHYEAMLKDPAAAVRSVADFLLVDVSDADVALIVERSSFKNMKRDHEAQMADYEKKTGSVTRRPGESAHFRRGEAGGWRAAFSESDAAKFDHLYAIKMAGSGLQHDFG